MVRKATLAGALVAAVLAAARAQDLAPEAAEVMDGLSADDVCEASDGTAECSLELRQLRAAEKKAAARHHTAQTALEASSSFGPNAQGEGMWTETTWDAILLELQASGNATDSCVPDTYGTCSLFGCADSRGATQCKSGKCLCADGFCAKGGTCFPKTGQCLSDTGGSCAVLGCADSRGNTKCKSSKCLCKTGGCAWKGKCYPQTDTGGSCSLLSCASSRGPTTCHNGKCLCKDGYVALGGRCESFNV